MIVDLTDNNASPLDPEAIPDIKTNTNIHINYVVTDKTDGDRNLLFINSEGKLYGIDRENTIRSYGVTIQSLSNTILDGEHITRSENDSILNNFYIFDAYIFKGENVSIKPFLFSKQNISALGRYYYIVETIKNFDNGINVIQSNVRMPLRIFKKEYFPSNTPDTYSNLKEGEKPLISENCNFLLNKMNVKYGGYLEVGHQFTYKTDGLVFLPNKLSLFQSFEDDYIRNPFRKDTWYNNYKWKPTEHLTIDFKIEIIKDLASGRIEYKYFDSNTKYVKVNLISSVKHYKNTSDSNNKLNFYLLNSGLKIQTIPEDFTFFATNPFIGSYDEEGNLENNMGEAYFEVDNNDNILCKNGNFITNGVICECSYDKSQRRIGSGGKGDRFCWKPERVRTDKEVANSYKTANAAWELINYPITKEKLSGNKEIKRGLKTGNNITGNDNNNGRDNNNDSDGSDNDGDYDNDDDGNGNGNGNDGNHDDDGVGNIAYGKKKADINLELGEYYSSNKNTEYLTKPLNKFNNFVKQYLINRGLTGYVKPKVLDLSVGKLGDMYNYSRAGVHTLIGIDISEDSINNPKDGASTRMIDMSQKMPAIAKMSDKTMLIVGDTSKNVMTGDCVRDNINKYFIDVLYGRAKGNTPKLKKMEGAALDGFDMVTCMYAIHYIINSEKDLDNFLRNVSENLLDQGYFIGTCLNGDAILNEMGNKDELKGYIDDKPVFLIKKESDDPSYYKKITVGNKIRVYYETFSGEFPENLVNISYLKEKAKAHNLKLIDFKSFLEEPGNLLSMYESEDLKNLHNAKIIKNSKAMMTWAKLNCYFMFQKVRKM